MNGVMVDQIILVNVQFISVLLSHLLTEFDFFGNFYGTSVLRCNIGTDVQQDKG